MCSEMFAAKAEAAVKHLGADGDLIYNENANLKIEMLTLVKVKVKTFWSVVKYKISDLTLLDLLQDPNISPEYTEKDLMMDFENFSDSSSGGRAAAGVDAPKVKLEVSAAVDTVDGASSFTLRKKTVDIKKLKESCADKKIKEKMVDMLKLKETEKLTFVHQRVYNTAPVTFYGKTGKNGLVSAVCEKFGISLWRKKKDMTSFTVPEDVTFAYSLMEITTEDNTLGIPPRFINMKRYNKGWWKVSTDGDDETLQQLTEDIFQKAALLQPLAKLCESRRCDLLKTLSELLHDRDALSLLEETLDQSSKGVFECPESPAVSSFMALLDVSEVSNSQKDAAHLLVSAVDSLPDDAAALLATCSPETLRVLQQLVNSLEENAQVKLPESLPISLQEEGELRWAAELLCLTDQMLTELRAQWDTPDFSPEVLLELVCLVVQGLSLMQPETHS
ncbi:gasdermin-E-like isoform X1 [Thunnus thynnus]|uniref:gasdermin-E-like isoform X1 n=1 Tax=Thunnus thynnus TaxID=8237 RepID=UPI003527FB26